jgi:hypothetical protein
VTSIGTERYALLLKGSHDARIANQVLPLVVLPTPHRDAGVGAKSSYLGDCLIDGLTVEAACLGVIVGCGSGNPATCAIALFGLTAALDNFAASCPSTPYDDGTIGWM